MRLIPREPAPSGGEGRETRSSGRFFSRRGAPPASLLFLGDRLTRPNRNEDFKPDRYLSLAPLANFLSLSYTAPG